MPRALCPTPMYLGSLVSPYHIGSIFVCDQALSVDPLFQLLRQGSAQARNAAMLAVGLLAERRCKRIFKDMV